MIKETSKSTKETTPQYGRRLVLFLDFLGFKELVERTVLEPAFLSRLVSAMDIVGEIGRDDAELFKSQRITQFSDSIVVSYDVKETSAVFWLLLDIALAVVHLAEIGFLVRGGLTVGDLYHSDRHVVGPAMVDAHRLEAEVAKFPRIVIDKKILEVARHSRDEKHSPDDEEEYVRAFMTEDTDGLHYFDYVSWRSVVESVGGDNDSYGSYLFGIGKLVKAGLAHADPHVQEKFLWLHPQYVAAIDLMTSLEPDNGYRLENPELCREIECFPRYEDLAAEATRAVTAFKSKKS